MRYREALRRLDPVDLSEAERVSSRPVFDELRREIMAEPAEARALADDEESLRLGRRPSWRRPAPVLAVAAAILLVVGLLVLVRGGGLVRGSGGMGHPLTTPWRAARGLSSVAHGTARRHRAGTWKLVDAVLSGTWQQATSGPPPGSLTCPTATTCYVMSGRYPSADAGAPLLSESLYVSADLGATWSVLPMPSGFAATSPLACGSATGCAAGGTYDGQPVLASTSNGGHTFTVDPLPAAAGSLRTLSCPSPSFCAGLAAPRADGNNTPVDATFLSTKDGGATFTDAPILAGDSMQSLVCSSSLDCTAVGTSDARGVNDLTAGVAAVTTDGGRTWTPGALPAGFGIGYLSQLACADALHCSVIGDIAITAKSPPQCASISIPAPPGPLPHPLSTITEPTPSTTPSPAVQAVSRDESAAATAANQRQAGAKSFSCSSSDQAIVSDIASTSDGGLTWVPDLLPADVPQPQLSGLACPTETECWAAGSDAVPQQVGNVSNGGSSVLLGTNDGGSTWSKVAFSVPAGAPNYDGQSYLSIGGISCPTADACVANGAAAQSSPSAPIYSLVVPSSS